MPTFLAPHKSGVHRIAAIALFRALLQQCRAVQLPVQTKDEIQNVIRNRFKSQRHVTSHQQLGVGFTAGYEAIDHLDAAIAGDESRKEVLLNLLASAPDSVKRTSKNEAWGRKERQAKRKEYLKAEKEERERTSIKLFQRPLPLEQLSGQRRKVPVLFTANHIPVLRLKKPQPESLSKYLDSRIKQRQRRHDRRHVLEEAVQYAREEDIWDSIVYRNCGINARLGDGKWEDVPGGALKEVQEALERERAKNREMAEKMQAVVDRETELANIEREERRKLKGKEQWKEWKQRKKARTVEEEHLEEQPQMTTS